MTNSQTGGITMFFRDEHHKKFYIDHGYKYELKGDHERQVLFYLLGCSQTTRTHTLDIYDIHEGHINLDCLYAPWLTSSAERIICLAFNLYGGWANDGTTPKEIFKDPELFPVFIEALHIRFQK